MHRGRRSTTLAVVGAATIALGLAATPVLGQSADDPVTITFSTLDNLAPEGEQAVIEAFMEANPGIIVEMETTPFSDFATKLTTEMRGGGGPDIGRVNHTDVVAFARAGFLEPLDDDIAAGTIDTTDFAPGLMAIGNLGGVQYSLPEDTDARVLFYSPKLLEAAGVVDADGNAEPPATWDELKDAAVKLKDSGVSGFAYREDSDYAMAYEAVGPFMVAAGGHVLVESGDGVTAAAASDPNTVAAVTLLQELQTLGVTPPGQRGMSQQTVAQLFANDQLAMYTGGPWMVGDMLNANPDMEYGTDYATAPIPVPEAGAPTGSTSGGWQLAVFSNTDARDAAVALLAFMMQEDNLKTIAATEGFPPLVDGMDAEPWGSDPLYDAFAEVVAGGRVPILPIPELPQVAAAFEKYTTAAIVDGADVTTQLQAFDDEVNGQILR